jgi:hypothetical protein
MAMRYTSEEKFDILECYITCNRNANLAIARYLELYPERQQPGPRLFARLVINLRTHGSFEIPTPKNYQRDNEARDENILNHFNANPKTSTRKAATDMNVPRTTIQRVLKKNKYRPYKPTIVQGLKDTDYPRRVEFSNWFVRQCQEIPNFSRKIIWTDETFFSNCGVFNRHNRHFWATENPHEVAERRLQVRFGFNVWCGMYGKLITHFTKLFSSKML